MSDSTRDDPETISELKDERAALAARIETIDGTAPDDYVEGLRDDLEEMDAWLEESIERARTKSAIVNAAKAKQRLNDT